MFEKLTNLWVAILGETQPDTHVFNIEVGDSPRWLFCFKFFEVRFNPG